MNAVDAVTAVAAAAAGALGLTFPCLWCCNCEAGDIDFSVSDDADEFGDHMGSQLMSLTSADSLGELASVTDAAGNQTGLSATANAPTGGATGGRSSGPGPLSRDSSQGAVRSDSQGNSDVLVPPHRRTSRHVRLSTVTREAVVLIIGNGTLNKSSSQRHIQRSMRDLQAGDLAVVADSAGPTARRKSAGIVGPGGKRLSRGPITASAPQLLLSDIAALKARDGANGSGGDSTEGIDQFVVEESSQLQAAAGPAKPLPSGSQHAITQQQAPPSTLNQQRSQHRLRQQRSQEALNNQQQQPQHDQQQQPPNAQALDQHSVDLVPFDRRDSASSVHRSSEQNAGLPTRGEQDSGHGSAKARTGGAASSGVVTDGGAQPAAVGSVASNHSSSGRISDASARTTYARGAPTGSPQRSGSSSPHRVRPLSHLRDVLSGGLSSPLKQHRPVGDQALGAGLTGTPLRQLQRGDDRTEYSIVEQPRFEDEDDSVVRAVCAWCAPCVMCGVHSSWCMFVCSRPSVLCIGQDSLRARVRELESLLESFGTTFFPHGRSHFVTSGGVVPAAPWTNTNRIRSLCTCADWQLEALHRRCCRVVLANCINLL